uniref:uncharacterized protein LOC122594994 isoform X1 n=1 Tax=Erigeron canadensis TaxID=72917 RepID=UPI001CB9B32C|nr:uncharacterized protein LOC122594994 isoform X1 [Erigeron canadensis]
MEIILRKLHPRRLNEVYVAAGAPSDHLDDDQSCLPPALSLSPLRIHTDDDDEEEQQQPTTLRTKTRRRRRRITYQPRPPTYDKRTFYSKGTEVSEVYMDSVVKIFAVDENFERPKVGLMTNGNAWFWNRRKCDSVSGLPDWKV